jgi:hypothetical protein
MSQAGTQRQVSVISNSFGIGGRADVAAFASKKTRGASQPREHSRESCRDGADCWMTRGWYHAAPAASNRDVILCHPPRSLQPAHRFVSLNGTHCRYCCRWRRRILERRESASIYAVSPTHLTAVGFRRIDTSSDRPHAPSMIEQKRQTRVLANARWSAVAVTESRRSHYVADASSRAVLSARLSVRTC